ncbi:MAG TPA: O-antigen ligase family protein [Ilumatobacter sp.]|nr:O-antigen ligase family protein [Ilumatobacter sp.]
MATADELTAHARRFELLRVLFAALGILVFTNGPSVFLAVRVVHTDLSFDGWAFTYPMRLVGLASIGLLARTAFGSLDRMATFAVGAVFIYVAWSLASVTWSVVPEATGYRAPTLIGVAAFGLWYGIELDLREQLRATSYAGLVSVLASAMLVLFKPRWGGGYWDGERDIHYFGIFASTNSLGPVCVLAAVSFVASAIGSTSIATRIGWMVSTAVATWLLIGTRSDTARVALALALATTGLVVLASMAQRRGASGRRVASVMAGVVGAVLVLGVWNFWTIARRLSSDGTLGGRRDIWRDVVDLVDDRPLRGFGYWAFWDQPEVATLIASTQNSAHNGLLEVALGLGVFGVLLFALTCGLAIVGIARLVWQRRFDALSCWWAVVLMALLAFNVTESFVLWNSYVWALLVAASVVGWRDQTRTERALALTESTTACGPISVSSSTSARASS